MHLFRMHEQFSTVGSLQHIAARSTKTRADATASGLLNRKVMLQAFARAGEMLIDCICETGKIKGFW